MEKRKIWINIVDLDPEMCQKLSKATFGILNQLDPLQVTEINLSQAKKHLIQEKIQPIS
jgi:hypothetical protein